MAGIFTTIFLIILTKGSISHPIVEDSQHLNTSSDDSFHKPNSADAIIAYALRICEECDYFLNGCPPPVGIFGVDCPQNGTETCGNCEALNSNKSEIEVNHHKLQKRTTCLHYGNLCSNGVCCKNEGLRCQTNSEGRGRNHLVCAYD